MKLTFSSGHEMNNRFALAPLTNTQSHEDGTLSEDEFKWLQMRAQGGFGLTMTCAVHVHRLGQGFPGQLGIFSDLHIAGHRRLAKAIKSEGSLAVVQLHHAGMRSPKDLIHEAPLCPSNNSKHQARALLNEEILEIRKAFLTAAQRAQKAGYDGVELHGAHGYLLAQFLSSTINKREDRYGGSFENRCRLLKEIIADIRTTCGPDFLLGLRLSPEKFGLKLEEIKRLYSELVAEQSLDFIDLSLWDVFKTADDEPHDERTLLQHFTEIDRGQTRLSVAGKIRSGKEVQKVLDSGVDFVSIGRSAILHHDFPKQVFNNPEFEPIATPVSPEYLKKEGLGPNFIEYMRRWPNFVSP